MSKRVDAEVQCPKCGNKRVQEIYRSLWVEYPENMALITSDDIFRLRCPACSHVDEVFYTFLATNVTKSYAVWFEPVPDAGIDVDCQFYADAFGPVNFYSEAPRIKSWAEFKEVLGKYDRGELSGTPIDSTTMMGALKRGGASRHSVPTAGRPGLVDRLKRLFKS